MKKWKVDYAYRKNGEYKEGTLYVSALHLDSAYSTANAALNSKAWDEGWDVEKVSGFHERFLIWNIGIVAEADEEVF